MRLLAPGYYRDFVCIADRCRHSCCIGWEIDIDPVTADRYAGFSLGYGKKVAESVEFPSSPEELAHFRLGEGDRCPHLDERGLCRIITELGEGALCRICREHPRFYNVTSRGVEVGVGMACEEACRLILSSDGYGTLFEVGSAEGEDLGGEFDPLPHREAVWKILSDRAVPYEERLSRIQAEFGVTPHILPDEEWREVLATLEYLDEGHRQLFSVYSSHAETPKGREDALERALAYFVYRHCTSAEDADGFTASLGFCLFCERLLASMAVSCDMDLAELARILSEELEYSTDNTDAILFEFII